MGYLPALDGVRAIAVLAVIAYHAGWLRGGFLGVDVFFCLSGFLITSLLVAERDTHGAVSLKAFYARRALRLLPALVPVLLIVGGIMLWQTPTIRTVGYLLGVASYLGNYVILWHGYGAPLDHFWSLAVEEQFYVLWPAVLLLLLRVSRPRLIAVAVGVASVAALARLAGWVPPVLAHPLMIGCALALVGRRRCPEPLLNGLAVVGGGLLVSVFGWARLDYAHSPASLLAALAILPVLLGAPWATRWLGARPLRWIGRRSYALYLWHAPLFAFVPFKLAAIGTTILLAALSYRLLEGPALAYKDRLPRWTPQPASFGWLAPVGVALTTALLFLPTLRFDFLWTWDDAAMLLWNGHLVGWSPWWALHSVYFGHYMPLTWWTWMVDAHLFGTWAGGWHGVNVGLHALSAGLLYLIAVRLIGSRAGAGVAALVWAVHPLRIESVVWISERKDCLSGLFVLLALYSYLRYVGTWHSRPLVDGSPVTVVFWDRARWVWYAAAFGGFVLACAAKSIAVVVVPFLVLLDWAVFRRWAWREKIPFVVVAGLTSYMAFIGILYGISNLLPWEKVGLGPRLLHVAYSFAFYVKQTVWPSRMSHMIEYTWVPSWDQWPYPLAVAGCGGVLLVLLWLRSRVITAAVAAYAVAVFPQAGLFHNGPQLVANRYTYLAGLPLALLVGAGFQMAAQRLPRWFSLSTAGAMLGGLAALTAVYLPIWTNDTTLQTYAAESEPTCTGCQDWAAVLAYRRGDVLAARRYMERALAVSGVPQWLRHERYWGYALLLEQEGDTERAKAVLRLYLDSASVETRDHPYEQHHLQDAEARLGRLEAGRR